MMSPTPNHFRMNTFSSVCSFYCVVFFFLLLLLVLLPFPFLVFCGSFPFPFPFLLFDDPFLFDVPFFVFLSVFLSVPFHPQSLRIHFHCHYLFPICHRQILLLDNYFLFASSFHICFFCFDGGSSLELSSSSDDDSSFLFVLFLLAAISI